MEKTKSQMESQTPYEACRKKRKVSKDEPKKTSGHKRVRSEVSKQLTKLMLPRYWSVDHEGPTFVMNIEHNSKIFQGKGNTKKEAQYDAAQKALRAYVQDENALEANKDAIKQLNKLSARRYWLVYQYRPNYIMGFEYRGQIFRGQGRTMKMAKQDASEKALRSFLQAKNSPITRKNVIMQLKKFKPQPKFSLTYLMNVEVNGTNYQGQGHTKMEAKLDAAEKALQAQGLSMNGEVPQSQTSKSIQQRRTSLTLQKGEAAKDQETVEFSSDGSQDPDPASLEDSANNSVILNENEDQEENLETSCLPFTPTHSSLRESDVVMMESVISIRCPITWKVMTDPVKNGYCGHRYEKEAAYQLIKNRGKAACCPMAGCKCTLNKAFLFTDDHLKKLIAAKTKSS